MKGRGYGWLSHWFWENNRKWLILGKQPNLVDDEFALSTSNTKEDILYPLKKNAHAKKLWDNFNSSQQNVVMKILEWINETRQYCFNNPENSYTFYFKNFEKYYSSQIAIGLVKDEENEYAINGYSLFMMFKTKQSVNNFDIIYTLF